VGYNTAPGAMRRRPVRSPRSLYVAAAALAAMALAPACSSLQARAIRYAGRPEFAPTDAATVQILHRPPMRPHDVLGEVVVETRGRPSEEKIEDELRDEAARMGGSAAVIVQDRQQRLGSLWTGGPWWAGGKIQPAPGDAIVAVVVRYVTNEEP
jgi:hypothetical protein